MEYDSIEFSEDYELNPGLRAITFYAEIGDDNRVVCRISREALVDYFRTPDTEEQAIENYGKHIDRIRAFSERLIQQDLFNESGEIFITNELCEKYKL